MGEKTGFILGATPRKQQIGELLGAFTSATFVCISVILLDKAYGFGTSELPAPQATLMKLVIEGVLDNALPWILVGIGVVIALVAESFKIPSLPFAVGVYLPVATMMTVFLGGMLRYVMERYSRNTEEKEGRVENGILFGSGLVGGEGLLGVAIAGVAFYYGRAPQGIGEEWAGTLAPFAGLLAFGLLAYTFINRINSK
jgi:putative OPT family oligopeptide transporter